MIRLIWVDDAEAIPDLKVIQIVDSWINNYKANEYIQHLYINISQNIVFDAFRLAILEKKIKHDEIELVVDDRNISFNEMGRPEFFPDCLSTYDNILDGILKFMYS
jgi:hypothetical protein